MTFFALKIFLPRLPTLASLVGATFAVLPAVYDACTNVTTGPSASPVTGLPTRTVLSQEKSVSSAGLLIAACFVLSMSSALWLRTPRSQRLHRQEPPPPPPPPPPPQAPAYNADPANDGVEDAEGNGGGGDDDPQEDGARVDGLPDNAAPDMQVADAPAPEDPPPPPPGGIEEDDDEDGDDIMTDSGLPWLILLLIGSALFSLFKAKTLIGAKTVKGVNADHKAAPVQVAQSTTIPGLLRRQIGFLDVGSKSVSSPATLIAGLLQRRPAAPRPSQRIVYQGDLPQEAAVPLQVVAAAVLRQQGRILPSWARNYALLVLLPFFSAVVALLSFTLPLGVAAYDPPPPAPPLPPPPDPKILEERIAMVELFQRRIVVRRIRRAARHAAKYVRQKEALGRFTLATAHRQTKTTAELQAEEDERARRERVREVQRRFWPLLVELAVSREE